jgi:hypothetical protein
LPLAFVQAGWRAPWALFPVAALFRTLWTAFHFQPLGSVVRPLIAGAILQAIVFWIAAALVFARRDVTISPE